MLSRHEFQEKNSDSVERNSESDRCWPDFRLRLVRRGYQWPLQRHALGATALVLGLFRNHHMGAMAAQKPVAIGSRRHHPEIVILHAIGAMDELQRVHASTHCTVTCAVAVTEPKVAVIVEAPLANPETTPVW